jgi:peptidoglycan/xylan/chitin deacetylase (PgdA/CDA1 family)
MMMAVTIALLMSLVFGQFSMEYPSTGPGIMPPVNPQFTSMYGGAIDRPSGNMVYHRCSGSNQWAFSFDDGPSPSTPALLDELQRRGIKATFFVIGYQVKQYPEILRRIASEGHEIGIHTWSHLRLPASSSEEMLSDILWTAKIIEDLTGKPPRLFRPPYGEFTPAILGILNRLGLTVVIWDRDTNDWRSGGSSVQPSFEAWRREPIGGHISLQHDVRPEYVQVAHHGFDAILGAGYRPVLVSECIGVTPYGQLTINRREINPQPPQPSPPTPPQPSPTRTDPVTIATSTMASPTSDISLVEKPKEPKSDGYAIQPALIFITGISMLFIQ